MTLLAVYSLAVFILDLTTPIGIEEWVLNLPVVIVPVFYRDLRLLVVLTLASSVMVALGSFLSPPGNNPPSWEILNRTMGLAAIWLIALLAGGVIQRSNQLNDALRRLRGEIAERDRISRALEQSEERLRLAMDGAGMGTWDVNLQTGRVIWSPTYLRMLGYEVVSERETTLELWRSRIHPDDLTRVLQAWEHALQHRSTYAIEYRINRADNGQIVWLAAFGRYYGNEVAEAARFLGVTFDVTRRKELEREAVEREVLAIATREQRQIGQELHDGVGQELTGLALMAQSLAHRLPQVAAEKSIAQRLLDGLDSVHRQVRELSRGLIPVHVESRGLSAALEDLAARATEASGISVTAECPEWVELPDHETATQLFRIAQEAVSNAVRHARPRHIRVTLLTEPNGLRLRIWDDGIGIRGPVEQSDGLGLRIMQYRAGQIGGVLQVGRSQGGGTVVSCTLPGSNRNDSTRPASCLRDGKTVDHG
jgi:PAS domain S-box-containing protein